MALNKSKIISEMKAQEIIHALKGYKDGTYGGALKATMIANAKKLNDDQITDLANFISKK